jgi:hypothetical protein
MPDLSAASWQAEYTRMQTNASAFDAFIERRSLEKCAAGSKCQVSKLKCNPSFMSILLTRTLVPGLHALQLPVRNGACPFLGLHLQGPVINQPVTTLSAQW